MKAAVFLMAASEVLNRFERPIELRDMSEAR